MRPRRRAPRRACTICGLRGIEPLQDATHVATGIDDLQWFECAKHGPLDHPYEPRRSRVTMREFFAAVGLGLPPLPPRDRFECPTTGLVFTFERAPKAQMFDFARGGWRRCACSLSVWFPVPYGPWRDTDPSPAASGVSWGGESWRECFKLARGELASAHTVWFLAPDHFASEAEIRAETGRVHRQASQAVRWRTTPAEPCKRCGFAPCACVTTLREPAIERDDQEDET